MRKIPTLFARDPTDRSHVINEVTQGCEWVLAGEGVATRKYDGTCILILRDGIAVKAFARREVKPGRDTPPQFSVVEHDPVTGKTVGWEPAEQSGFAAFIEEAIETVAYLGEELTPGTYELIGPKINGNPETFERHDLIRHGSRRYQPGEVPTDFDGLRGWLLGQLHEGIVWHHPDGRMAKLKRRDFQ